MKRWWDKYRLCSVYFVTYSQHAHRVCSSPLMLSIFIRDAEASAQLVGVCDLAVLAPLCA